MKLERTNPPREFGVGKSGVILKHCATIELLHNEVVTFLTKDGLEYDVVRKSWGYYATPSLESRLDSNGFDSAIVRSKISGHHFVVLIEKKLLPQWRAYADAEDLEVVSWLNIELPEKGNLSVRR